MSSKRQTGVTLIELIVFIMIIGVALLAILGVLSLTTKHSADPLRRKQALMIAEGLLEEVELARFTYCQPGSENADTALDAASCADGLAEGWGAEGGSRPHDNINDYAAAANQANSAFDIAGQLADANGNAMPVTGYTARVTITPQALGGIGGAGTSADTEVLRIRVEVSYGNDKVVLDGFRMRYAPNFL
ncbi:prepilin-type N-terminal cleavage/methylation domain-containing protein [Massilia sp. 9I]|uniref:type IV pilus modification PilV family protein n=1 Tax=Massilia sp. 9I TaxID=2653152 RepID=UPI0012F437B0|nr:prepilin-type N-terminal cleavage/methylation domain-containing protein [Massilia sp. 9I]VXB06958.1 MSHA pilin protein MshD [Massilia sp. 9I]